MLERNKTLHSKQMNIDELKHVLQVIWDQLPQVSINKAIGSSTKGFRACLKLEMDTMNMLCDKLKKDFLNLNKKMMLFDLENYKRLCFSENL